MNDRITITPTQNSQGFKLLSKSSSHSFQEEKKESLDLPGIRDWMGKLWVPTYLPAGLVLKNTSAIKEHALHINFERMSPKSILDIMESPKSANLHIPSSTYLSIVVHGQNGFIVRGSWVYTPSNMQWQESICLWLTFEIDSWIISLTGIPAKTWSEQELIKIAESMKEY